MLIFWFKVICVYFSSVGFGLFMNLPHKALNFAGFDGVLGWLIYYWIITPYPAAIGQANFWGGLVVGLSAIIFARIKRMPSILFEVTGLVPLVPGGQAYNFIKNFALGNYSAALNYLDQVILIAGGIALGFIVSELLLKFEQRIRHLMVKRAI